MSKRLNQEREKRLQPKRIQTAIEKISSVGFEVYDVTDKSLCFDYNGSKVIFWPYSGWASGKTINDGRGLNKLMKQINPVVVDFKQLPFEGDPPEGFIDWAESVNLIFQCERHECISISNTGEDDSWIHVNPGDYVLLDENGIFYSLKNPGDLLPSKIDD